MRSGRWRWWLPMLVVVAMVAAACAPAESPGGDQAQETDGTEAAEGGDGTLSLGYILPETGQLADFGPAMIAAVEMAVERVNEAGGVLGEDVELSGGDEADQETVANQTADRLLADDVDAIVGAAASAQTLAIIDKVTGAGVAQCSGSNTTPTLTDYADDGLYFRTTASDVLQGPVLAETILEDGATEVAIMARADDYGEGLAEATLQALEEAGASGTITLYDPDASTFDAEVQTVADADPDAVALLAFDEGGQIISTMIESGIGPDEISLYGADGLFNADLWKTVDPEDPAVLEGMRGTGPNPAVEQDFLSELEDFADIGATTTFAGQKYDCVNILALAAVAAESDDATVFADRIVDLTQEGETCDSFEQCSDLLDEGEDIDYQGVSGPLEFTEEGEPASGSYLVWEMNDEGVPETTEEVTSSLEGGVEVEGS
ncbi:MAG: ABC transporter substrate-binding protein [Actinomycetota bacterium]|nr:ABC transporter substrate-binding protein [Actinomycetota bacterium]